MRSSVFGRFVVSNYLRLPVRSKVLAIAVKLEGGPMLSTSLREVLRDYFKVTVGDFSYGSLLHPGFADAYTIIGRYVSVGPGVRRIGAAHPLDSVSMHPFWYNPALGFVDRSRDVDRTACVIGHDCWIGANSIILPGCRSIGIGAVIGAGSIVTKDVPPFAVVAGNPARVIRYRFSHTRIEEIIRSEYWMRGPGDVKMYLDGENVDEKTQ